MITRLINYLRFWVLAGLMLTLAGCGIFKDQSNCGCPDFSRANPAQEEPAQAANNQKKPDQ